MIQFNKDNFVITVETGTNPIEDWQMLQRSIINCLYLQDKDFFNMEETRTLLRFFLETIPEWETAKKML